MSTELRFQGTAPLEWRLKKPWRSATGLWNTRRGVIVSVTADGVAGVGEASPLPGYSPDDLDECTRQLSSIRALPPLDESLGLEDAVAAVLDASGLTAPAARFALETATLDALARLRGVPLFRLLRPTGDIERVPISGIVAGADLDALLASAGELIARGVRTAKMKLGTRPVAEEIVVVRALASAVGDRLTLRFDANGALSVADARVLLEALAELSPAPELVEEPVAVDAWDKLPHVPVPLALDESLQGEGGDERLAARAVRCRAIVLKPTVLGGTIHCLRLARSAAARGVRAIVTHTVDGSIATAAAAHLALAIEPPPLPCGLDVSELRDSTTDAPWFAGSEIVPSTAPGLGIET